MSVNKAMNKQRVQVHQQILDMLQASQGNIFNYKNVSSKLVRVVKFDWKL